jgi:hypothetical protein
LFALRCEEYRLDRSTIQRLSRADLHDVALRVFAQREATLLEVAAGFPFEAICATLVAQLAELAGLLGELPDGAFESQPDDVDGNDVWSAGQIVSHIAEMELAVLPFWETVIGSPIDTPGEPILNAIGVRLLSREAAIACARDLEISTGARLTALPPAPNPRIVAALFDLGTVDARAALLATCIHNLDHLEQLEELGVTSGASAPRAQR